jgi:hypothetical protein
VHPLRGTPLAVLRTVRSQEGQQYVDVEHPKGGLIRVPLEWTDRRTPVAMVVVAGQQGRLNAPALLKLAEAVEEGLKRSLAVEPAALPEWDSSFHHASSAAPALVTPARGNQDPVGGGLGQPAAQAAARRGWRRRAAP